MTATRPLYYILAGHTPIAVDWPAWAQWLEAADDARVVAKTAVPGGEVSTVFLGLDHRWSDGPPLIFETMVFGGTLNGQQQRYSTWEEAEAGHREMVQQACGAIVP